MKRDISQRPDQGTHMSRLIRRLGYPLMMISVLLTGCQSQPHRELAEVPPPVMDEGSSSESVNFVTPEPEPVVLDHQEVKQPGPREVVPVAAEPVRFSQSYTIRKGDTLWSIAREYYGDGKRWREIAQANPHVIPEKLRVGQVIMLP